MNRNFVVIFSRILALMIAKVCEKANCFASRQGMAFKLIKYIEIRVKIRDTRPEAASKQSHSLRLASDF